MEGRQAAVLFKAARTSTSQPEERQLERHAQHAHTRHPSARAGGHAEKAEDAESKGPARGARSQEAGQARRLLEEVAHAQRELTSLLASAHHASLLHRLLVFQAARAEREGRRREARRVLGQWHSGPGHRRALLAHALRVTTRAPSFMPPSLAGQRAGREEEGGRARARESGSERQSDPAVNGVRGARKVTASVSASASAPGLDAAGLQLELSERYALEEGSKGGWGGVSWREEEEEEEGVTVTRRRWLRVGQGPGPGTGSASASELRLGPGGQ
eukprot:2328618-Rhodomonas_salina.1